MMNNDKPMEEICNNCGESVKLGSGKFVNRIPSGNSETDHEEMGMPYPKGGYMCAECDEET